MYRKIMVQKIFNCILNHYNPEIMVISGHKGINIIYIIQI